MWGTCLKWAVLTADKDQERMLQFKKEIIEIIKVGVGNRIFRKKMTRAALSKEARFKSRLDR